MTKKIPFVKMHGLGNDFVIISETHLPSKINMTEFAIKISDRRLGIGCDQFITYDDSEKNIQMSIYNQDGSKALACGNASRCLSRLIFDQTSKKEITLHVGSRKVICEYIDENNIKVDMGPANFNAPWMPGAEALWKLAERYLIEPKEVICADVANPHLVIFSKLSDKDQEIIGAAFQKSDLFKDGVNVNFAKIDDNKIHLKVWERGAGFTLACGSGAIATFASACKLGFAAEQAEIVFKLGSLQMQKQDGSITMRGPASYVFSGEYTNE